MIGKDGGRYRAYQPVGGGGRQNYYFKWEILFSSLS